MPVIERLDRGMSRLMTSQHPALRLVDRVGRRLFGNGAERLGERLTFGGMIPLGPNGRLKIEEINPQVMMMDALGPNGGNAAPKVSVAGVQAQVADLQLANGKIDLYLDKAAKPGVGKKWLMYGLPALLATAAKTALLPLTLAVPFFSNVALVGLGSKAMITLGVLANNAIPGVGLGLLLGVAIHLIARGVKRASAAGQLKKLLADPHTAELLAKRLVETDNLAPLKDKLAAANPQLRQLIDNIIKQKLIVPPPAPAPKVDPADGTQDLNTGDIKPLGPSNPPAPPVDFTGKVGGYTRIKQIGQGGFGAVYLVKNVVTNEPFVVKVIDFDKKIAELKSEGKSGEVIRKELIDLILRFEQEYRIQANFSKPPVNQHLCPSVDTNIYTLFPELAQVSSVEARTSDKFKASFAPERATGKEIFIVNHLVPDKPGSDKGAPELSMALKRKLDPADAIELFLPVLQALGQVHTEYQAAHRDLKPKNILLTENLYGKEMLVVIDWGIAKDVARETQLTSADKLPGTFAYMPPMEHYSVPAKTDTTLSYKWDIYQMGLVILEAITRTNPLRGKSLEELVQLQANPKQMVSGVPNEALQAILAKMLATKPEDNYASMAEVVAAFEGLKLAHEKTEFADSTTGGPAAKGPTGLDDGLGAPPLPPVPNVPPPLPPVTDIPQPNIATLRDAKRYLSVINTLMFVDAESLKPEQLDQINLDLLSVLEAYPENGDIQLQYGVLQAKLTELISGGTI